MVDSSAGLDVVFRALADPTRRAMIQSLASRPRTVGELAEPFHITLAGASKHVQVLERAGLLRRTVQGRTHVCRLEPEPLREGMEWMRRYERFWTERLDALDAHLRAEDANATPSSQSATPAQTPDGGGTPATQQAARGTQRPPATPRSSSARPSPGAQRPAGRQQPASTEQPAREQQPLRGPRIAPRTNRRNRP